VLDKRVRLRGGRAACQAAHNRWRVGPWMPSGWGPAAAWPGTRAGC
jgi:hypothetical protein